MTKTLISIRKRKNFSKVFKNDVLTKASFKKYSLSSYRVTLMLNEKFHQEMQKGEILTNFLQDKKYRITAEEYSAKFSTTRSVSCRTLRNAVDILVDSNIELESDELVVKINFCSYAKYLKNHGVLYTVFTKDVFPFLAQNAKRYTLYNLNDIVNFKSLYSVRLFELIQGFKYSGWMIKTLDELRIVFNTGPKLQRYDNFKNKTFVKAINEINRYHPQLDLKFEEIYERRKVQSIKFFFKPTNKEIGEKTTLPQEIKELLPMPNIVPLDKRETKEKLRLATERKKQRQQKALQKQIEAGISSKEKENVRDKQMQIARNMLSKGSDIHFVSDVTGLSLDEIKTLQ